MSAVRLIPPFVKGDGRDFSNVILYTESDERFCAGQIIVTPGGQDLLVDGTEVVEDIFESYMEVTVRVITPMGNTPLDPRVKKEGVIGFKAAFIRPADQEAMKALMEDSERMLVFGKSRQTGSTFTNRIYEQIRANQDSNNADGDSSGDARSSG